MLQVDYSDELTPAQYGDGEKGLKGIFGEIVEKLEPRILGSVGFYGDRLTMLGDPAGDSLTHAQLEAVHHFRMRILGSAQYQFISLEDVNKTGIALYDCQNKVEDASQHFVEGVGRSHAAADVVE